MDRWKSSTALTTDGSDVEKISRRRSDVEKIQVREKVGKSRNPVFFGSGGTKSRLAKAAGAEAAGQMKHEKLRTVVARSTFGSENVQNTSGLEHFLEVELSKKCTPLWREAHLEVKMRKHFSLGALLEVKMSQKCTPLWREARLQVKSVKKCEDFWKWTWTCGKSARHCRAKHIWKSKV